MDFSHLALVLFGRELETLDIAIGLFGIVLLGAFGYIIRSYAVGLKDSPRELFLVFISKIIEYSAYGAMNLAFVLFLSSDCGLDDVQAGTYIGIWSMVLTVMTMLVGPIADTFGIRRTLLVGAVILIFARLVLPLTNNIYILSIFGFLPLGIGMVMQGPVLSVAIKHFTSKETAALGFGLFYTLMNVGWAIGAWIFDFFRRTFGETTRHTLWHTEISNFSLTLNVSTYQLIFIFAFFCTILNVFLIWLMREGVEFDDETNSIVVTPLPPLPKGRKIAVFTQTLGKATIDAAKLMRQVFTERAFWIFIGMLSTLIFVRLVFYHFHYTFPKYGIRVLGEGMKIGSIFGVLNPVMIIFLTPLIAALTKKAKSYTVLVVGTFVSSLAIFIATMPGKTWEPLVNTWIGELIYVRWLEVPEPMRQPLIIGLVFMVIVFTVGEAIWSPRLMQFTAEIAPKGKEGSYIALSYLPYFGAKFFVGPLSGWLVATYTPEGASSYPHQYMVWVWIGAMAILSPVSLLVFRKVFLRNSHVIEES